ncbi:MAG: DUF2285 domain-containing protein [Burkholderiaceae bacterium]|nr:DUF2285 domain-containing protein [Burkholderiaceae bacterium]
MVQFAADHWHPCAAYLYILHLDGPALAWEYLRRHPDYRRDWLRRRRDPDAAQAWGLRLLEDPGLDAREAHPAWFPDHDSVVQLYPDADPPPDAERFAFWRLSGSKHLVHDGRRLVLLLRSVGHSLRAALAPGMIEGVPYVCALRASRKSCSGRCALMHELTELAASAPMALAQPRPTSTALLELHTLQALDGALAGASLRAVAQVLFGVAAVAGDWHADGALRARVRRLIRRGRGLMGGGYRQLAQLPAAGRGRFAPIAERP